MTWCEARTAWRVKLFFKLDASGQELRATNSIPYELVQASDSTYGLSFQSDIDRRCEVLHEMFPLLAYIQYIKYKALHTLLLQPAP